MMLVKRLAFPLGLLCWSVPAFAAAPPEVMTALKASPFREYVLMEGRTELLGKIQAGKRKFWVVTNKIPGLKHSAAGRLFCRIVFLEEKSGQQSYLGYYRYHCEEFRVNGQRVESFAPKDDGTPRWLGFTLTEKGPPPGLYDSPEFYPFTK
jgi:hypothetical protein